MSMDAVAGRSCPLRYRYDAGALAQASGQVADTLYVIGGLYGNRPALATIEALAARERGPVTLCFNGDFNWFNVDDEGFVAINRRVLAHDAIQGNVEAEFGVEGAETGCGCAYPDNVDAGVVERSNAIHARLKATAHRFPDLLAQLAALPMFRRYQVGDCAVGVVHGDAESLAGWRFDVTALDDPANRTWIEASFQRANVDVYASTHTCLPALRGFSVGTRRKWVINNGAAGMPNFAGRRTGLITRISVDPLPADSVYATRVGDTWIEALELAYDHTAWKREFLANWPPGSAAYLSYIERIVAGPHYSVARAHRVDRL